MFCLYVLFVSYATQSRTHHPYTAFSRMSHPRTRTHHENTHAHNITDPPLKKKLQRLNLKECEADSVVDNVFESGVQLGERIKDAVAQFRV